MKRERITNEMIVDRIRMREREVRISVGFNKDSKPTSIHFRNYWLGTGLSRSPYEHVRIPLSETPRLITILAKACDLALGTYNETNPYAED